MKCSDVDLLLSEGVGNAELMDRAGEHVRDCERCRALLEVMGEPIAVPCDEEDLRGRIVSGIQVEMAPARPMASGPKMALGIVGVAAGSFLLWTLLMGIPGYGRLDQIRRIALTVYSFVLLVLLSVSLTRLIRPAAPRPISPGVLLTGVTVGYPVLASMVFPMREPQEDYVAEGVVCLLFGLITAVSAGALMLVVARRGYALHGGQAGAVLGALSGLTGILVLQWVCPDPEGWHVAVWHGLVGVLSVLGGTVAGWLHGRQRSHAR